MQQRRLRLGDILDDYCPRERRITNHVVVAMIEDDVRQTRCTTCDAEHEYKQAKVPTPRRKKTGALSQDVPEDARPRAVHAPHPTIVDEAVIEQEPGDSQDVGFDVSAHETYEADVAGEPPAEDAAGVDESEDVRPDDEGPVHRRLIRATLPRPEGHVPERKEPEFTMRQPGREANGNRPGGHRSHGHRGARQAQGHQQGGHNRFGGQRQGNGAPRHGAGGGQGPRQGNRPGQPSSPRGGGGGRPGGQNRGSGRKRGR
jgi:hypothetical protein